MVCNEQTKAKEEAFARLLGGTEAESEVSSPRMCDVYDIDIEKIMRGRVNT